MTQNPGAGPGVPPWAKAGQEEGNASRIAPSREQVPKDIAFLKGFGIAHRVLIKAAQRAEKYGVSAATSLMANSDVSEREYYRAAALTLGLPYEDKIVGPSPALFEVPTAEIQNIKSRLVRISDRDFGSDNDPLFLAPDCTELSKLSAYLDDRPAFKSRCRVTRLSASREHSDTTTKQARLGAARFSLRDNKPAVSARRVFTARQAVLLLVIIQFLILLSFSSAQLVVLGLHMFASFFYLGCVFLRLVAAAWLSRERKRQWPVQVKIAPDEGVQTPYYSIMVALYKEAGQVEGLVKALLAMDWPREKLEIKLICEEDDPQTIAAVQSVQDKLRTNIVQLVIVPVATPRTKPKALNYALPLCRGDYIVIYDAEDRPHPQQLREARASFREGPENLGCVQAPLVIHNHSEGWLPSLFALEYSALFRGLLPALAARNGLLPLGGTSNHFKQEALQDAMGWDPYNVTEDADLGIRLTRSGWQIGTITLPTLEEAPVNLSVWLKQRTRWLKGWMQTVLVHLRHPSALHNDLGFMNSIIFYLIMPGMVISSLVHPVILGFIIVDFASLPEKGFGLLVNYPLFLFDLCTIALGYLAFAALAWQTLPADKLAGLRGYLLFLPFYWLLVSIAAWRALLHLFIKPHEWEKTPHRLTSSVSQTIGNQRMVGEGQKAAF